MTIAGEPLVDIFHSLSSKRRNGVLRVNAGRGSCDLCFVDGRIVQLIGKSGEASNLSVRLARAGYLNDKVFHLVQNKGLTVGQLYDLLVGKKFVTPVQFQRAKTAHDMDVLHGFGSAEEITFDFAARDIRPDPRFTVSISAGQLLLDYCELHSDEDRFRSIFPDPKAVVARNGSQAKTFCEFERPAWELLEKPRRLEDLFCGVVSEYDLREGLLALFDRGLLALGGSAEHPAVRGESASLSASLPEEKQDLWHRIADEAVGAILEEFHEEFPDDLSVSADTPVGDALAAATAPEAACEPETMEAEASTPPELQGRGDATSDAFDSATPRPVVVAPPSGVEFDGTLPTLLRKFFRAVLSRGLHAAFFETNHLFLEKSMQSRIMLVTVLAYLVSLLFISVAASGFVEGLFRALSEFTSSF